MFAIFKRSVILFLIAAIMASAVLLSSCNDPEEELSALDSFTSKVSPYFRYKYYDFLVTYNCEVIEDIYVIASRMESFGCEILEIDKDNTSIHAKVISAYYHENVLKKICEPCKLSIVYKDGKTIIDDSIITAVKTENAFTHYCYFSKDDYCNIVDRARFIGNYDIVMDGNTIGDDSAYIIVYGSVEDEKYYIDVVYVNYLIPGDHEEGDAERNTAVFVAALCNDTLQGEVTFISADIIATTVEELH